MELGTYFCNNKLYNLNFIKAEEVKQILKFRNKSKDFARLRRIYEYKITEETIKNKVQNQINTINVEINQINSKFIDSPKNYNLIKGEINKIESDYFNILRKISYKYDEKIEKLILKLFKNENKLLKSKKIDLEKINNLKKENIEINKKINELSAEKIKKVQGAMESEEKRISTKIVKPKNFRKITRFFVNKFNTYNVITKNILTPIRQRIDDYLNRNINLYDIEVKEFDLEEFDKKLDKAWKQK